MNSVTVEPKLALGIPQADTVLPQMTEAEVTVFASKSQQSNWRTHSPPFTCRRREGVTEKTRDGFPRHRRVHRAATILQVFTEKTTNALL